MRCSTSLVPMPSPTAVDSKTASHESQVLGTTKPAPKHGLRVAARPRSSGALTDHMVADPRGGIRTHDLQRSQRTALSSELPGVRMPRLDGAIRPPQMVPIDVSRVACAPQRIRVRSGSACRIAAATRTATGSCSGEGHSCAKPAQYCTGFDQRPSDARQPLHELTTS